FYSKTGVLYASGSPQILRSTDNGATFMPVGPKSGFTAIIGDGQLLYTAPAYGFGPQSFITSDETDGSMWTPYQGGTQKLDGGGPCEMAFDEKNGIIYASNWFRGIWALHVVR